MPRSDLYEPSAPRAELDQRSREARLRLERVERLLVVRLLPKQSLLRRVLRCLGLRIYTGQQIGGRSAKASSSDKRSRQRHQMPGESGGAAGRACAAALASPSTMISWPSGAKRALTDSDRQNPPLMTGGPSVRREFAVRCQGAQAARIVPPRA
jgi:hypothetical protein